MKLSLRVWAASGMLRALIGITAAVVSFQAGAAISVPLRQPFFEENKGQAPEAILYQGRFHGFDAAILRDGSLALAARAGDTVARIRLLAKDSRKPVTVSASGAASFRTNYFRGPDPTRHVTGVAHYARVTVGGIYPGTDLVYHVRDGKLEFDFALAPGANPGAIRMQVEGAAASISADGDLELTAGSARWTQRRPVAFQEGAEGRRAVEVAYRMGDQGEITLALGQYDESAPLVVDPIVDYSSYLGGTGTDEGTGVAVGADGFVYVVGRSSSSNFPVVAAADPTLGGAEDAFIAKINPATGKLVYATYLGGGLPDSGRAIAVDSDGAVYVTGVAGSRFPTTNGAYQTASSSQAGFVTKLNATGSGIVYSTLLYGATPTAIAVDAQGRAAVAGSAGSAFVPSAGAFQATFGGAGAYGSTQDGDVFALVLNAAGNGVAFASYLGGSERDGATGVAFDGAGRVVVAGTASTLSAIPMVGAFDTSSAGLIAAFAPDGASLAYSTRFGAEIASMAMDPYGNIVIAGRAGSDLPTVNALRTYASLGGGWSGTSKSFVGKIGTFPLRIIFSTYGGTNAVCCDEANGVAVDGNGDIYIHGTIVADSLDGFQAVHPFLSTQFVRSRLGSVSNRDAYYVAGYARDGQRLRFQTLVAGHCGQGACRNGIGANPSGLVAVAGMTFVDWHPVTAGTTQAALAANDAGGDVYVVTLASARPSLDLSASHAGPSTTDSVTLTATSYTGANGTVTFKDGEATLGTAMFVEGVAKLSTSFAAGVRRLKATVGATESPLLLLPVDLP